MQMIMCDNPLLMLILVAVLALNIGLLLGAWWQSKPISRAEMEAELNTRRYKEIDDEDLGV